jgi:acyl-coenzyme A synthetase/AMP-(fatty) acid ligase
VGPSDVAVEIFTSGTTGTPKRIPLTFRQLETALASALQHTRGAVADRPLLSGRPGLVALPLVHISGLWGVLQSLVEARPFVLLPRFTTAGWVAAVAEHRPPVAGLPPAAIRAVLEADVPPEALSSLRAINSGTAPLDPALAAAFTARFGIPVLSVYGATEFSGAVAGWSIADHRQYAGAKRGSVGRAFPHVDLRAVKPDGTACPPGEVGHLEVRTPQAGADDWVRTHDLARIDDDGFVWIAGRADDVIVRGGFKVTPTVVAAALARHPAVREAAVVGLPDERLGQVPVAAVELEPGALVPDPEELREFCRADLTPYEVPVAVVVVPALPRGAAMKVDRTALTTLVVGLLEPAVAPG